MNTNLSLQQSQNLEDNLRTAIETHTGETSSLKINDAIIDGEHGASIILTIPFNQLAPLITKDPYIGAPRETTKKTLT